MADSIVYKLVTKGGGIDGRDHHDKGGTILAAYLDKQHAEADKNLPWCDIKAEVVDLHDVAAKAIRAMDPVTRLAVANYTNLLLSAKVDGKCHK